MLSQRSASPVRLRSHSQPSARIVAPMSESTSLEATMLRLDRIVEAACVERSHVGVFPAMYRSVTAAVLDAIRTGGFFDNDELVEHLTVVFADLYFQAYDEHRGGQPAAGCWV